MNKVFFISDTHFSHCNILKYEPTRIDALVQYLLDRQLATDKMLITAEIYEAVNSGLGLTHFIELHDKMLIDYWNTVVSDDDEVWFLGDLCFANKEKTKNIVKQLKGHKYMIEGNHDHLSASTYIDCGFEQVVQGPIILKDKFILTHTPQPEAGLEVQKCFIYGHVHSQHCLQKELKNCYCVCVEETNFRPIEIEEYNKIK